MTTQQASLRELTLENRDKRTSSGISAALLILFILSTASWWKAILFPTLPSEQSKYLVLGAIDFGDFTEGSGDVNNFLKSSPTPGPEEPAPSDNHVTTPVQDHSQNILTGDEETGITAPPTQDVKPTNNQQVTTPKPPKPHHTSLYESDGNGTANNGGANHGSGTQTGNRGNPNADVLYDDGGPVGDPKGYAFTGLKRKAVSLPAPVYTSQKEAKLTFKFKIAPSGKVVFVERPVSPHTELVKAGMDAIYKWKFNEVEENAEDQWVSVTITFKLK